jgi:hypothetical protein
MKYPFDYMFFLVMIVVFVIGILLSHRLDKVKPPEYIKTFCQAQQEIYEVSFTECMNQYKSHNL